MANPAIALIVAGTGETTAQEVFDLLEDAYPISSYDEIGVLVPVDKDLFSQTVQNVVEWYGDDENVYPVQTEGASMTRAAAKLGQGTQKVDKFTDLLNPEEFKDWDEVHVLIAMPDDPEDPKYDFYAEVVEVALDAGFVVKDLTGGLDDVRIADEEAPAEEPESEPEPPAEEEKPTRRRRGRAADKDEEPAEEPKAPAAPEEKPKRATRAKKAGTIEEVKEAARPLDEVHTEAEIKAAKDAVTDERFVYHPPTENSIGLHAMVRGSAQNFVTELESNLEASRERSLAVTKIEEAMFWANAAIARYVSTAEPAEKAEEPKDEPKRGRGRPRTKFEVKQIWDEEKDDWIPRPAGRMSKGTEWRTIHSETGDVLEEGTA